MRTNRKCRGWTLLELLVVITSIAILISLMLPAMAQARRQVRRVACTGNIRSYLVAMTLYAQENQDALVGGPWTSGQRLLDATGHLRTGINNTHCPELMQIWDWATPLARQMGQIVPEGDLKTDRVKRWNQLVAQTRLRCPENEILGTAYTAGGGPSFAATRINSYVSPTLFHLRPYAGDSNEVGRTTGSVSWNPPAQYRPLLSRVGPPANKVFLADGARYSNAQSPPDIDLDIDAVGGGAFGDVGAFSRGSNAWDRFGAPENRSATTPQATFDPRIWSFRHGQYSLWGPADSYRANLGFFDGHVETLGDLQAAEPSLWGPSGSDYRPSYFGSAQVYPDVLRTWLGGNHQNRTLH